MMKYLAALSAVLIISAALALRANAATPLAVGVPAPNFTLPSQEDRPISLAELKGRWVVLYFYPKDQTAGCTIEAHNFQRDIAQYDARNAVILGVSLDTVASHKEWCAKDTFSFKMLADPGHKVIDLYGVGITNLGIAKFAHRDTFLISPEGKIVKVWTGVSVNHHSEAVLAELAAQQKH